MSVIRGNDERLHHCDGSHRWVCPDPDFDAEAWRQMVEAHVDEHRRPEVFGHEPVPRSHRNA